MTLPADLLGRMDSWWRAANYLSAGQIYLLDNPLLRRPLAQSDIKPRLLGHWGTTPGLNFIYVHLNRVIRETGAEILLVAGPGHGAPGLLANAYLEGTYSELYPDVSRDEAGLGRLLRQFSFPGGVPSHAAPETPGSINEGGELGYSLSHAFGAVLDNPALIAACVVGDGEAETGPLAASWHANKFLNPATDGAVLPILHLNGYKIANPTVLARITEAELRSLLEGYGWSPVFVGSAAEMDGSAQDAAPMHHAMAAALDDAVARIRDVQQAARTRGGQERPRWPMLVLRSPKGWTAPKEVDGEKLEGFWRAHQVPFEVAGNPDHLALLERWLRSYRPEDLFGGDGRLAPEIAALAPDGGARMSASPHANGGVRQPLRLPPYESHAVALPAPGAVDASATAIMGGFLRDVLAANAATRNFRVLGPDETESNRLEAVLDASPRAWNACTRPWDTHLGQGGRVMEILSEHTIQGWLEGYLLTGRHGLFSCYEAFIHIIDSMLNQHAKWLKTAAEVPWRSPVASLNYLLTSHVWQQDHNGFSHQDPGFIDHVVNKKPETIRVYLPPDANTLLWVTDHCLRTRNRINVIVAGKQPAPQWLSLAQAVRHCSHGIGLWDWAGNDAGAEPDVVMACAGDVPTRETLAAVDLLRRHLPDLLVRVVNVVDLMKLPPPGQHPHGLPDRDFDALFTRDRPVVFAYHGYPWLIHRLCYKRANHGNMHVRGYLEEGTTTTPFDMTVRNRLDRFQLVMDVIDTVPGLLPRAAQLHQAMHDRLMDHRRYIEGHGEDMPEIVGWRWEA